MKYQLVNLTGHKLSLTDGSVIKTLPSQGRARVVSESEPLGEVEIDEFNKTLPITALYEQTILYLPEPEEGTLYIVSGIVASAASERDDVVAPGQLLRTENGRVIAAQGFVKPGKKKVA